MAKNQPIEVKVEEVKNKGEHNQGTRSRVSIGKNELGFITHKQNGHFQVEKNGKIECHTRNMDDALEWLIADYNLFSS